MSDTEQPVVAEADPFGDAFAEAVAGELPAKEVAAAPEPAASAEPVEPVAEAAADPAPVEATEKPAEAPAPAAKPDAAPSDEDVLKRLAAAIKSQSPEPERRQAPQPEAAPQPDLQAPSFSSAEQAVIEGFKKDWPDVHKAYELLAEKQRRDTIGYVFAEVAKELAPALELAKSLAERQQLIDLRTTVNDYDDIRGKVVSWVEKQPDYLKPAYQHVVQSGTVEQVKDLIDRYRRDTSPPVQAAPVLKNPTGLTPAVKKAAAALAPVIAKRSNVSQGEPQGFDDTWEMIKGA